MPESTDDVTVEELQQALNVRRQELADLRADRQLAEQKRADDLQKAQLRNELERVEAEIQAEKDFQAAAEKSNPDLEVQSDADAGTELPNLPPPAGVDNSPTVPTPPPPAPSSESTTSNGESE